MRGAFPKVNFAGFVQVGGLYQDYEGDKAGASLGLFATLPKIEIVMRRRRPGSERRRGERKGDEV